MVVVGYADTESLGVVPEAGPPTWSSGGLFDLWYSQVLLHELRARVWQKEGKENLR